MKAYAPFPSLANSYNKGLSNEYPKPKVLIVQFNYLFWSLYSYNAYKCPLGGITLGNPSVNNKIDELAFCEDYSRKTSNPLYKPPHKLVISVGLNASSFFSASFLP